MDTPQSPIERELWRLRELCAMNLRLVSDSWRKARELEQLLAARKDARAMGRQARLLPSSTGQNLLNASVAERASAPRDEVGSPTQTVSHATGGLPLLLIVEDEEDDFALLQRAFHRVGVNARTIRAKTAHEALDALREAGPEISRICVVSDIRLPDLDGFELLHCIRIMRLATPLRLVFLTGHCDSTTKKRAQSAGVDAFYTKPLLYSELLKVASEIEQLFELVSYSSENQNPKSET